MGYYVFLQSEVRETQHFFQFILIYFDQMEKDQFSFSVQQ